MRSCSRALFGGLLVLLSSVGSCTDGPERSAPKVPAAPTALVEVSPPPKLASADAGGVVIEPKTVSGEVMGLELLADGTLTVETETEVVTVDDAGTVRRAPIPKGKRAQLDSVSHRAGLVIEGADDVTLLETPTLKQLYSGPGRSLPRSHGAIAIDGPPRSVLMQVGSTLARLDLPATALDTVETVEISSTKKSAVVTTSNDDGSRFDATVFDVASGRAIGRAEPTPASWTGPKTTLVGDVQYAVSSGILVVTDLSTGAVRRASLCPKSQSSGNPMMSPAGDLLLVTCDSDGLAIDPRTLATKRRYTKLMPGCDNGDWLPAHFDAKDRGVLVLDGCGGEARLDLATGKYRCSDDVGLVGAPYEMTPAMGPGGPMPLPRSASVPADRRKLPRCRKEDDASMMPLSDSKTWFLGGEDNPEVIGPGVKIPLEPGAQPPTLSLDETKMAYVLPDRIVLRSLPSGAVILELARSR